MSQLLQRHCLAPWPVLRRCQGPRTPDALSPALLNARAKEASVIERLLHSVLGGSEDVASQHVRH